MVKVLSVGDRKTEYELDFKNVKNINLRVNRNGVFVSASTRTPLTVIEKFLISKSDFIFSAIEKYKSVKTCSPFPEKYSNGEEIYIFRKRKILHITVCNFNGVEVNGETVTILSKSDDVKLKERIYKKWLYAKFENIVTEFCREAYPNFTCKLSSFPTVKFRRMKSRWGSCNPSKKILTFNYSLAYANFYCIRYVVYHEFTHFIEANHQRNFYAVLSRYVPDWKALRKQLNGCSISG